VEILDLHQRSVFLAGSPPGVSCVFFVVRAMFLKIHMVRDPVFSGQSSSGIVFARQLKTPNGTIELVSLLRLSTLRAVQKPDGNGYHCE
jgi:hypothetical protein